MNKFGNTILLPALVVLLRSQILHFFCHTKMCTSSNAQSREHYITATFTDNSRIVGAQYDLFTLWRQEYGGVSYISTKFVDPHVKLFLRHLG